MATRRQHEHDRQRTRDAMERDTPPGRDPDRLESAGKRLQADARPDQPMPLHEDRDDEFPER